MRWKPEARRSDLILATAYITVSSDMLNEESKIVSAIAFGTEKSPNSFSSMSLSLWSSSHAAMTSFVSIVVSMSNASC